MANAYGRGMRESSSPSTGASNMLNKVANAGGYNTGYNLGASTASGVQSGLNSRRLGISVPVTPYLTKNRISITQSSRDPTVSYTTLTAMGESLVKGKSLLHVRLVLRWLVLSVAELV